MLAWSTSTMNEYNHNETCALSCSTIKGFASLQRAYLLGHAAPEEEVEAAGTRSERDGGRNKTCVEREQAERMEKKC